MGYEIAWGHRQSLLQILYDSIDDKTENPIEQECS